MIFSFDDRTYKGEVDLAEFGENNTPDWLVEENAVTVPFSLSEENYKDFNERAKLKLNTEYKVYSEVPVIVLKQKIMITMKLV